MVIIVILKSSDLLKKSFAAFPAEVVIIAVVVSVVVVVVGVVPLRPSPNEGHDDGGEDEQVPQGRQGVREGLGYVALLKV